MKTPKYIIRTKWAWRVKIKQGDWTQAKHFSFERYGGIKHALNCAIDWRNRLLEERGMLEYLDRKKSPDLCSSKRTRPCIGVYRSATIQNGKPFYHWTTSIHKDGNQSKAHFSINLYGEEGAFLLACEARYLSAGMLIVVNKKALPCRPLVPYRIKS